MTRSVEMNQHLPVSAASPAPSAGRTMYPLAQLARGAGITALVATAGNVLVYAAGALAAGVPGEFIALNPVSTAVATVLGTLLGAVGLWVLAKLFGGRGALAFSVLAALFTLVSLGGPVSSTAGMPGMPPATVETAIAMGLMHIIAGGLIAFWLPALARER